ncbi:MAG: Slp family lipoprotein [Nitrospinota bacterium]|nr:Slp family lipoprotein [Nitrospinota bacterium]
MDVFKKMRIFLEFVLQLEQCIWHQKFVLKKPLENKRPLSPTNISGIHKNRNFLGYTEIEVVQKELDSFGYPNCGDQSGGRFIFVKDGFLDSEIYAEGRYITGAGNLDGDQTGKVDQQGYRFPVIHVQQLHLWEKRNHDPYYGPYRYDGFYGRPFMYQMGFGYLYR